ncbi:MAG TPA: FtsX-like permease family protein [Planctomycetota bacterium]|nr:FtsX-like permease family protein [Planctomycetota bacterium]
MSRLRRLGGLFLIVRRSLRQHALSTAVTLASAALASGLVMAVFSVNEQTYDAFTGGPVGFDAVLGARGSQLQLVLNTVFHLETSPGNIPWELYTTLRKDPRVQLAIPYAVGDNYNGFRIVGTTPEMFTEFEYQKGRKLQPQTGGRVFDPGRREAVIGSTVAQKTGLRVGSTFNPYHGIVFDPSKRHEEEYVVVGVTGVSNSPSDRVVWIPLEGIFRMEGHVLRGTGSEFQAKPGEQIDDRHKEVSAVMLKFKSPQAGFLFDQTINRQGKAATLAWPIGKVMAELFDKIGWVHRILGLVAYLVVAVAAGSILASIYNTMNERRREFAILRALGARRRTVFSAIILESTTISTLGAVLGYAVYGAIVFGAAVIVRRQTGVALDPFKFNPSLVFTLVGMSVIGAGAGVIPALKAYSTDVASNLVADS